MNKLIKRIRNVKQALSSSRNYFINCLRYYDDGKIDESFKQLLYEQYLIGRKNRIIDYYRNNPREKKEYLHELKCLKKSLPYLMTCDVEDFRSKQILIQKDLDTISIDRGCSLYYLIRNGRKLYFKRSLDSVSKVREYYEYLAYEQTEKSPHRYLGDGFDVIDGMNVVDCGAAEGVFGLDNIDKIGYLYNFECEDEWVEALSYTFKPYENKVETVCKYLGDVEKDNMTTIDIYFAEREIDFLKMDVEGFEQKVLKGASKTISTAENLRLAIAAYHSETSYDEITAMLRDYEISTTKGYLLYAWETSNPPFFRKGIVRAQRG